MGIVRVTARPSKYAFQADCADPEKPDEEWIDQLVGKMYLCFRMKPFICKARVAQREIAKAIGKSMGVKPIYQKGTEHSYNDFGSYEVGDWHIEGFSVASPCFDLNSLQGILDTLGALNGMSPDGSLSIRLVPERLDMAVVRNVCTVIDARKELIAKALSFEEEFTFILGRHPTFSIPLDVFDLPVIEACVFLYYQVAQMACTITKARMKPCDLSNPKYYMRTWLLRLGFIGPKFERPRQTLLEKLDGNTAFFTEQNRQKALEKAKDRRRRNAAHALLEV